MVPDYCNIAKQNLVVSSIYRGSYISAHVLLNLLKELLAKLFIAFSQEFNKFNNTGARILDSIYHMAFKLLNNLIFGVTMSRFCHFYTTS